MRGRRLKKPLTNEERRARDREYHRKNRSKRLRYAKEYRARNRERLNAESREYYYSNRSKVQNYSCQYTKKRRLEDPSFRIATNLRARIGNVLKFQGVHKDNSTLELLGCTKEELQRYLESQFTDGMNWENYGRRGWHIDHIRPLASFNLTNSTDLRLACHHTNLQPLWWQDNLAKRKTDNERDYGERKEDEERN